MPSSSRRSTPTSHSLSRPSHRLFRTHCSFGLSITTYSFATTSHTHRLRRRTIDSIASPPSPTIAALTRVWELNRSRYGDEKVLIFLFVWKGISCFLLCWLKDDWENAESYFFFCRGRVFELWFQSSFEMAFSEQFFCFFYSELLDILNLN